MTVQSALKLAASLPDIEYATSWGVPAVKIKGQMFACQPTNKAAEPNSLVVRLAIDARDALIAEEPATYYLKEHYVDYPCVLVRLNKIHPDAMRDLLTAAYRYVRERGNSKRRASARSRRR